MISAEEMERLSKEGLDKPLDNIDWEDNESDGSEYKDSIRIISGEFKCLPVSGAIEGPGEPGLDDRTETLFIDAALRRSGSVSKSRECDRSVRNFCLIGIHVLIHQQK